MKRVVLRIGCGAVCAALALTLGCGCALLPPATGVPGAASSAVSVPTDDSGKPLYAPAVLNDGRLRVLYCDGRSGSSTTILCGSTPLHQSTRSENVSLVQDSTTGTADYWLRSWSDPTGRGGRRTALYDKTGTEVMSFEGEQNAALQNGLLVLQESRLVDGGYVPESGYGTYGTCQVIALATGAALPVRDSRRMLPSRPSSESGRGRLSPSSFGAARGIRHAATRRRPTARKHNRSRWLQVLSPDLPTSPNWFDNGNHAICG